MDKAGTPPPVDPLAGLIDIPLPLAVSLWPQTWMSRFTIVFLAVALVVGTWRFIRWWRANRYRRVALAALNELVRASDTGSWPQSKVGELAILVRRTALAAFPREEGAGLSGSTWLAFLDRSYGGGDFSQGPGKILCSAPYKSRDVTASDIRPLIDLIRRWIKRHHD